MMKFTQGNLLDAPAEALVNTVNTVGVMGKGVALMFKEAFPANFRAYEDACKQKGVKVGKMFATENRTFSGPRWIINFPTKKHWRQPSKLEWIIEGLGDLRKFVQEHQIRSIALPPLGAGNGGLDWSEVRPEVERILGTLEGVDILVFEPTAKYQNVAKRTGVEQLTPARALMAEMIRRYWVLGIECTYLEVQKLGWFLERSIHALGIDDPLNFQFKADKYGPFSDRLRHMLDALDGTYLHCDKRLSDAGPSDTIWFDESHRRLRIAVGYGTSCNSRLADREGAPGTDHCLDSRRFAGVAGGTSCCRAQTALVQRSTHRFGDRSVGCACQQLTSGGRPHLPRIAVE